jgi:DNA-directed RNA polymerase specialized sigma24 family protein
MPASRISIVRRSPSRAASHPDLFLERYDALLVVARRLVGDDRMLAEDLVHDAYVQFVLSQPDLARIEHLDAYLAGIVRNLHFSRLRRQRRQTQHDLTLLDFDSAELALRVGGLRHLEARDALARTCAYVLARKDDSRAASVLALRFFIGFYPTEIARLARTPVRTVYDCLRLARADARVYLDAPDVRTTADLHALALPPIETGDPVEVLHAVRRFLLARGGSPCPGSRELAGWYEAEDGGPLSTASLAHLVSCRGCLDRAAALVGIAGTADRLGGDSGNEPPTGASSGTSRARRAARRAQEVFEHRPRQLFVTANGLPIGVVAVESAWSDVRWTVRLDEPLAFAEVSTEQSVVLSLLSVAPVPAGDLVQRQEVALSDGRHLTFGVDATEEQATLFLQYSDPLVTADSAASPVTRTAVDARSSDLPRWRHWLDTWRMTPWRMWALASPVLAGLVLWVMSGLTPSLPAADRVIADAEAADVPPATGEVRQQRWRFTEVSAAGVTTAYLVERWESGNGGARATRVYDASGAVRGGEWVGPAGQRTTRTLGAYDEIWRAGLSARAFRPYLTGATCTTSADRDQLRVDCVTNDRRSLFDLAVPGLIAQGVTLRPQRAELLLESRTLRVRRLGLTMPAASPIRHITMEHTSTTRLAGDEVPAGTFVPDVLPNAAPPEAPKAATPSLHGRVTPSVEVQILEVIGRLPVSASVQALRRADGRLSLVGHVAATTDRRELLAGLDRLDVSGLVDVDVDALDAPRRSTASPRAAAAGRAEWRELPDGPAPFEGYLRRHRPGTADPAGLVRDLAPQVLPLARQQVRGARSLEALLERFPPASVGSLDAAGRRAWTTLASRHAAGSAEALTVLSDRLAPYFEREHGTAGGNAVALPLEELVHQLAHEATLVLDGVTTAFSASLPGDVEVVVRPDFVDHIHDAHRLAEAIRVALATHP